MKMPKKILNLLVLVFLACVFIYAIAVRIDTISVERLWPDEALYAWLAEIVSRDFSVVFGPILWYPHPPLFPILLALGVLVGSNILENLRLITFFIDIFTLLGLYIFAKHYFSRLVACVAVAVVASNIYFNFTAGFILMDTLFAALHILFMALLLKIKVRDTWGLDDFWVGLSGVLIAFLKYYGGLFLLPWVLGYYFIALKDVPVLVRFKRSLLPLIMIGAAFFPFLINTIIPALLHGMPKDPVFTQSFFYYFQKLPDFSGGRFLFFLFLMGIIVLWKFESRIKYLLLSGILIEVIALSSCSIKDLRYLLPTLLLISIIIGIAVDRAFKICAKNFLLKSVLSGVLLTLLAVLFINDYYLLNRTNERLWFDYSGFREAGAFIKEHDTPGAQVLAGGIYQTRFWSKIELQEYGGRVHSIPRTEEAMKMFFQRFHGHILMEVDLWQYVQPPWVYPMTPEKFDQINELGFKLTCVVKKKRGSEYIPVTWVFERPALQ